MHKGSNHTWGLVGSQPGKVSSKKWKYNTHNTVMQIFENVFILHTWCTYHSEIFQPYVAGNWYFTAPDTVVQ